MLDDPRAKIARAYKNLATLTDLITVFADDAYSVDMQPDFWTEPMPPAVGDVIIWAEASKAPPSIEWGPIIGDVVHGFRSALDQLIWSLSIDHQAPHGPPAGRLPWGDLWRNIWFPICCSLDAWKSGVKNQLWALDPALVTKLKPLQPFVTGKHAPDREPLAVLQELWNIDKHRHLHLVNATVELHDVLTIDPLGTPLPASFPDVVFEVISKRAAGPLIDRTEIGRARLVPQPGGIIATSLPQMHMNPRLAIDVAFDQGYPAYGGRVLHTLGQIGQTVEAIVAAV